MPSKVFALLALASSALPAVWAQAQEWGQCGGMGWNGPTTCASGLTCTQLNPWYYQCLRTSTTSTRSSTSSTRSSSTSTSTSRPGSSSTSSTSSAPSTSGTATFKSWFSFGDSYTATGFSATGTQPSRGNPLGNPTYPGNTACGTAENWIDFDTVKYNTTFVETFNYAYSGATIDNSLVGAYSSSIPSVSDQVNSFLQNQAPGKPRYNGWTSTSALFSVWIGINDLYSTYNQAGKGAAYNDVLLNRYFQLMQSLYAQGARNFLFLTVPPVYRTPLMISSGSSAQAQEKTVIDDYNAKLAVHAASFVSSNSGVTAQVYDTTPIFNTILNNPSAYGLRDATSYGDGNTYAWCNVYHPSPPVHNEIAKSVAALIAGTYI